MTFLIIIFSEASLRYSTISNLTTLISSYSLVSFYFNIHIFIIGSNMLKTYEQYLIKNFLSRFLIISLIFLA